MGTSPILCDDDHVGVNPYSVAVSADAPVSGPGGGPGSMLAASVAAKEPAGSATAGVFVDGSDYSYQWDQDLPVLPGVADVDPKQVFSGPGYNVPRPPRNMPAVWALFLGVATTVIPVMCIPALVLGIVGLRRASVFGGVGRRAALSGIYLGGLYLALAGLLALAFVLTLL